MFAITSTRIVGLIAVVCAVVVAPQALAASSAHSRIAPPDAVGVDLSGFDLKAGFDPEAASRIAPPDAAMGYDLCGFDLSALNNIPGYQQQQEYLKFLARASADTRQSVDAARKAAAIKALQRRSVDLSGFDLKAGFHSKAAEKAAAIAALQRRSIDLEAAYRKLHPDAYRPAVQPAVQKSDTAAVWSFPVFCNGLAQAEYDYVYSGCQG